MNKFIFGLILLCSSTAFGYVSGKAPQEEKPFYCPASINCTTTNIGSCTFDSEYKKSFGNLTTTPATRVAPTNAFMSAQTTFHSNVINGKCQYENDINLEIKPEANLEAYYQTHPNSSWDVNAMDALASCTSSSTTVCPLKRRLGFVIHNVDIAEGVNASINNNIISRFSMSYGSLIFDDALVGCTNTKECTIDLISGNNAKQGSVTIDMDTMQIISATSTDATVEVNKIDSDNLEIKKIDREKAIFCPQSLQCSDKTISSCQLDPALEKYFKHQNGLLNKAQNLEFRSAYFDSTSDSYFCEYNSTDRTQRARLQTKPSAFLVPQNLYPNSKWQIVPLNNKCESSNSTICPFKKSFGFVVKNKNLSGVIYASVKEKTFKVSSTEFIVTHDDLAFSCNGEKECVIDLTSFKHAKYGSVTVQTDTMKILKATSLYPAYIGIDKAKDDLYENVEIGYVSR